MLPERRIQACSQYIYFAQKFNPPIRGSIYKIVNLSQKILYIRLTAGYTTDWIWKQKRLSLARKPLLFNQNLR